jgi:hypothetical protein
LLPHDQSGRAGDVGYALRNEAEVHGARQLHLASLIAGTAEPE